MTGGRALQITIRQLQIEPFISVMRLKGGKPVSVADENVTGSTLGKLFWSQGGPPLGELSGLVWEMADPPASPNRFIIIVKGNESGAL